MEDAVTVVDAVSIPDGDYFDPTDIYTAIPKSVTPRHPYTSYLTARTAERRGVNRSRA